MRIPQKNPKRKGVSTVELSVVSILLFMTLFGIFEYCRLLYVTHVANNAARDTVRYAVVHTGGGEMPGDPATITTNNLINLVYTGQIGSETIGSGLAGMDKNIQNCSVAIFAVDPVGLSQNPPIIQPSPAGDWTTASFGQMIAVQITGSYIPMLPSLFFMNSAVPFQVTVIMSSEAN